MRKYPNKTICTYSDKKGLHDVVMNEFSRLVSNTYNENDVFEVWSSTTSYSKKDWNLFLSKYNKWEKGYKIIPNCRECRFRFKCWTGNIPLED